MNEITTWLQTKTKDYDAGLLLYRNSAAAKSRTLSALERGKSARNLCVLIKELRTFSKSSRSAPVKKPELAPEIKKIINSANVQNEQEKQDLIHKSAATEFKRVRLGDLPKELRPKYKRLSDLWYQMCELKFAFNDLKPQNEKQALQIILNIEKLDEERDFIWKELDHWTKFKTLLPVKTEENFSELTPRDLYLKQANLENYIYKKNSRIETWKQDLKKCKSKPESVKLQEQINRTLKAIHEHEINLKKIEELM